MIDRRLLNLAIDHAQSGLGNLQSLDFESKFVDEVLFSAQDALKAASKCIEAFRQELDSKFGESA